MEFEEEEDFIGLDDESNKKFEGNYSLVFCIVFNTVIIIILFV